MRVELGKLLTVLAHELRGPLGVIQGYLRLMLQRHPEDPDAQMIKAMLDATGRLSRVGRQAADLATWTDGAARTVASLTLDDLAQRMAATLPPDRASLSLGEAGPTTIETVDAAALAAALAAVVESIARDTGGAVVVAPVATDARHVRLAVRAADPAAGTAATARPFSFERGGAGLALVLASFVLDAHAAEVTGPDESGAVVIHLQKDRGSR
jgi:signal transduction histidine kinase